MISNLLTSELFISSSLTLRPLRPLRLNHSGTIGMIVDC